MAAGRIDAGAWRCFARAAIRSGISPPRWNAPGVLRSTAAGGMNRAVHRSDPAPQRARPERQRQARSRACRRQPPPRRRSVRGALPLQARAARGHGARRGGGFVKLLLEGARQSDYRLYVVLTMRSEFIGALHGIPRPGRGHQRRPVPRPADDARRGPARRSPARSPSAAARSPRAWSRGCSTTSAIIADQLPILQHALMRTWDFWEQHHADGRPIDLQDYEAIGTMADALSQHAEEAYGELATEREPADSPSRSSRR